MVNLAIYVMYIGSISPRITAIYLVFGTKRGKSGKEKAVVIGSSRWYERHISVWVLASKTQFP